MREKYYVWWQQANGVHGHSEKPMDWAMAKAWADHGNRTCPIARHWVAIPTSDIDSAKQLELYPNPQ